MSKIGQILHDPFANRLAVFAGALIVITWGLLGLDIWIKNVQGIAAASEQAAATAQALDERVVRTLSVADQFLKLVSGELLEMNSRFEARVVTHKLRRLDPLLDEILTISFVNDQGISIGHSNPTMQVGSSYLDSDFFRAHAAATNLGLYIEKPQLGQTSGQRVFTVSRRISATDGAFLGVLVAVIRIDALAAEFADSTIGKNGATTLFHIPSSRIIIHQPNYHVSFGKTMPYGILQEVQSDGPKGVFRSDDSFDGEQRIFAYRRIKDLPLAVSVGLATSEIPANLMREFVGYMMMTLLLTVIIGGGAVYVLTAYQREIGLQESMRRWQLIFEHAGWGMAVISADGKTLQQMNPAFALMHGYSIEDLTGQPIEMVLANEARNNLPEYCSQNHKAGHRRFESLHKHRNGRVFTVLIDATTISGKAGEVLYRVVSVEDISEIRHVQEEIRIANEIFQHTFNASTIGMVITDVNGRYTRVNQAMCELTGYPESELLTMSYVDITHPEDVERDVSTRQSLIQGQCRSSQMEKRYIRKDGRVLWALVVISLVSDTEGKPLYSIGQILDVDAQKRAEQGLRLSEERFRGIFENANTGIAASDKTGRLTYFNEAFRSMLGHDAETLKQMHFEDLTFPEDSARDRVLLDEITLRQREKYRIEKRFIARDGQILWVDLYVSTIRDDTGDIVNFICIINEITERKQSALALADSRQQLRALAAYQEETLELERKHIAREVHDELGQLLTALKMDISLVRLRYGKNLELLGRVDEMRSLVDRTINVVRQVSSNLRPAALDLGLTPAIEWLAENFTKRWSIRCRLEAGDSDSEIVLNDLQSTAVFRIVQESLTNIARHAQASEVVISLHTIDQRLQIIVKDDGHGFATEAVGKGRGFGLLGMRERVLALRGTLHIDSAPGKGTSVAIELPLSGTGLTTTMITTDRRQSRADSEQS